MSNGINYGSGKLTITVDGKQMLSASSAGVYVSGGLNIDGQAVNPAGGGTTTNNFILSPSGTYDTRVSIMLNFNGENNSTNIIDNSYYNNSVTVNGDAKISTAQSKFGSSSLYLDGTGDYLDIPTADRFGLGTGNFTIEYWWYPTKNTVIESAIDTRPSAIATPLAIGKSASGQVRCYDGTTVRTGGSMTLNDWNHVAWCRSGSSNEIYLNGTSVIQFTNAFDAGSSRNLRIGASIDGNEPAQGYFDDIRITKGFARYTGSFAPPTVQLTAEGLLQSNYTGSLNVTGNLNVSGNITLNGQNITSGGGNGPAGEVSASYVVLSTTSSLANERVLTAGNGISIVDNGAGNSVVVSVSGNVGGTTTNNYTLSPSGLYDTSVSLMLNFSGANNSTSVFDKSYNTKTVTVNGDAKISTTQSKYGGSSLYLDGNGDYLSVPSSLDLNLGTGDFTIEFWAYCTDNTNPYPTYIGTFGGWSLGAFGYRFDNTGQAGKFSIHWNPDDPILTTTSTFSFNQWRHTALVRSGTNLTLYVDGNQEATTTIAASRALDLGYGGAMHIGWSRWDGADGYMNDYIDDLRITRGVARYTGNFTPPTQELTAELPLQTNYTGSLNVSGNLNVSGAINTTGTNTWAKPQVAAITNLTSTSNSTAVNLGLSNNYKIIMTENTQLANPTNATEGQSGVITIVQPAGAYYTMSYGTYWKFASGSDSVLTAKSGAIDVLAYYVASSSYAICNLIKDFA